MASVVSVSTAELRHRTAASEPLLSPEAVASEAPFNLDGLPLSTKVHTCFSEALEAKQAEYTKALSPAKRWGVATYGQFAADFSSFCWDALMAIQELSKVAAQNPIVNHLISVLGFVAGPLMILQGLSCLNSCIEAFKCGDKPKGWRLLLDACTLTVIGALMLGLSIAKIAGLTAITAFFAANVWILPLLFFIITIPLLAEVIRFCIPIWKGTDMGSQMKYYY